MPAATWPDLPTEVKDCARHFNTVEQRNTIVYLPVHRSIDKNMILSIGKSLNREFEPIWSFKLIDRKQAWLNFFKKCSEETLLQTWEYGQAKSVVEKSRVYRVLIKDESGVDVAICQILVENILGIFLARINLGPLFLRQPTLIFMFSTIRCTYYVCF